MKIALVGYGKMGQMVELAAKKRGHEVVAIMGSSHPRSSSRGIDVAAAAAADVCIDFSHPDAVLTNVRELTAAGIAMVIGTTGWESAMPTVEALVRTQSVGVVYGPNFSLGVNLFLKLVASAATLLQGFPHYHAAIHEEHHKAKVDSPSGTAKAIAQILSDRCPGIVDDPVAISSLRCGCIPGTHSVVFDGAVDTITLTHTARGRDAFAEGAVAAAEWIADRKGLYHFSDMLSSDSTHGEGLGRRC